MLPAGWDLARVREQLPAARLLDPSAHDVFRVTGDEHVRLDARTIIDCDGLCLVLADPDDGWWMGQLDRSGESIVCWGTYAEADDLATALAAL